MKTKIILAAAFIAIGAAVIANFSFANSTSERKAEKNTSSSIIHIENRSAAEELRTNMRKLWEDHVLWTRNVILCLVDELPGANQSVNRLLQNQVDIGDAIKPYYGDAAGEKLTGLLKPHITIAAEVVTAAKKGDNTALDEANKRWHANADEISEFLSSANPNWELTDIKTMMNDHLKLTTDEAIARIQKDYDADIAAYDKVHKEILMMSDMLADGIIKQFPDKFKE
jgi:hypothetical protein